VEKEDPRGQFATGDEYLSRAIVETIRRYWTIRLQYSMDAVANPFLTAAATAFKLSGDWAATPPWGDSSFEAR
jgi:hypothetical protein